MNAPIRLRVLPALLPINGREVELQASSTHIQWRYIQAGSSAANEWANLIPIASITGPAGPSTQFRVEGDFIQYAEEGTSNWLNLIDKSELQGEPGLQGGEGPAGPEGPSVADGDKGDVVVSSSGTAWELSPSVLIQANTTINVPADYPTIRAAWDSLARTRIADGVTVTIDVADGTHVPPGTVHHPDGGRINIIGNTASPDACILNPGGLPTDNGFAVDGSSFSVGLIDGFRLDLDTKATIANNFHAIVADNGGYIRCGSNMKVNNWYYSYAGKNNGVVFCRDTESSNAGDVAYWAFKGGMVDCRNAIATGASDVANGYGFGFQGEYGGVVDAQAAQASGCNIAGIAALSGGVVRGEQSSSSNNTGSGYYSADGGYIYAQSTVANNNGRFGWDQRRSGTIYSTASTRTGNALGATRPKAYDSSEDTSARWGSNTEDLYLFAAGPRTVHLESNGKDAARAYNASASAVNYLQFEGSVAGQPVSVKALGTDTNINLVLLPRGTGRIQVGPTQAIPGGFANNCIFELLASDGTVIQIEAKRL